jgi:hypothetical protein
MEYNLSDPPRGRPAGVAALIAKGGMGAFAPIIFQIERTERKIFSMLEK